MIFDLECHYDGGDCCNPNADKKHCEDCECHNEHEEVKWRNKENSKPKIGKN